MPLTEGLTLADGMYANFAGRDASRGMAKQSFDEGKLTLLDAYHILTVVQRC